MKQKKMQKTQEITFQSESSKDVHQKSNSEKLSELEKFPYQHEMETAFGMDLSFLRISYGSDSSLEQTDAKAAAVGDQIFLSSSPTKEDIAHEIAHVIQNRVLGASTKVGVSNPNESAENQADNAAKGILKGDYKSAKKVVESPKKGSASIMRSSDGPESSGIRLSQDTRSFLYVQLAQRTTLAAESYRAASEAKVSELKSALKNEAAIGGVLFSVGMAIAAPGIGAALAGLINSAGFRATYNAVGSMSGEQINAIGQSYVDLASRAPAFVSAGTHIGKHTFQSGLSRASRINDEQSFLASSVQGFRETVQQILDNAPTLSDEALMGIVGQFDVRVMTDSFWAQKIEEALNQYQRSVEDIAGPHRTLINILEYSRMTNEPKFLARGVYHAGAESEGEQWMVVKGFNPEEGGELYEHVPAELLDAAIAAHHREWNSAPPTLQFIGNNRMGPL